MRAALLGRAKGADVNGNPPTCRDDDPARAMPFRPCQHDIGDDPISKKYEQCGADEFCEIRVHEEKCRLSVSSKVRFRLDRGVFLPICRSPQYLLPAGPAMPSLSRVELRPEHAVRLPGLRD